MGYRVEVDTTELRKTLEQTARAKDRKIEEILQRVGARTVEHLQSFTAERRSRGRRAHPGGWADRSGKLADAYGFEVTRGESGWELHIVNTEWYAAIVEAKEGLFVVRGVAEPGGPVQTAFVQAVHELAPEWVTT